MSITKIHIPLLMQAAIIGVTLVIAAYLWRLDAGQTNIRTLIEERTRAEERYQSLLQENIKLQIENAGLRTTSMGLATEIANLRAQKGK